MTAPGPAGRPDDGPGAPARTRRPEADAPHRLATPPADMLLTTPRLILRRFRTDDAAALAAYRSDPDVARYQGWSAPVPPDAARGLARAFAAGSPERPGWFQYAVTLGAGSELVGDIGVCLHDDLMQAHLGYTFAPRHQGLGYATEAVGAVLADLFGPRGLHRVSAECDARNERSAALLRRLGFTQEGHRREAAWMKGEWTDELLFGLLAADWRKNGGPGA
ncbi:GNAT family N-acetyltransferase [Streptomyces fuscigenes]|uniref:GNAT family N-acetyltransferase n=1 Tax=Streptomyces fuscigenes TaxID=1528880 RepID=UPI001F42CBB2|nr:GNAT family protein [Streptomyces fuscigenes]MCF3960515.1 GNAT family N-acetyltransferase [Streptomyces fuscigenes]